MSGKLKKLDEHVEDREHLHPSLARRMQESFQSMPCDRAVFEKVYGDIVKPMSWSSAMLVGLLKTGEKGCCSSWTTWRSGCLEGSWWHAKPQPHLSRNLCHLSLATFIIPICRWIASKNDPADESSRIKRHRPSMYSDVDQSRPSATGSAPDAELLAVLSAEATRVASEETQARKQTASRSCAGVSNQKSRKDGSMFASDAKKEVGKELDHTSPRRVWPVSIPSSASRPSSSRTESSQLRSNATRQRSTNPWPLQKCRWTS